MLKRIINYGRFLLERFPVRTLQRLTKKSPCIVLYHAVADNAPDHWKHLIPCRTPSDLRRDLDFLLKYFKPVSLEHLENWAFNGAELPPNAFHFTVDDGLREAVENIAPICVEKAVPATFFLTTSFIDNQMLGERHLASLLYEQLLRSPEVTRSTLLQKASVVFPAETTATLDWAEILLPRRPNQRRLLEFVAGELSFNQRSWLSDRRPYAETADILKLLSLGFTIGAHSITHPYYPHISLEQQIHETIESIRYIESHFSTPSCAFAIPFGTDGIENLYHSVTAERPRTLFFSVGPASPYSTSRTINRIPLDSDNTSPADVAIRKALATRLEHRFRRTRTSHP